MWCNIFSRTRPDIAVQGLIKAVLSQDSGARIDVEYMRPFFRFGNGKWGQALYKVKISSWVSGQQRCFSLFSLPNPEVMHEKNLVPILVGMDHLGIHGCQMLVDFGTGLVMDGVDTSRQTYQLRINSKGHLVYDVLYHLTRGHANHEGHATIHVASTTFEKEISVLQFQPLEFYVSEQSPVGTLVGTLDERKMLLQRLYDASRGTSLAQMQAISASDDVASVPLRDQLRYGAQGQGEPGGEGPHGPARRDDQEAEQEDIGTSGQGSSRGNGSTSAGKLAVLSSACGGILAEQPARDVESLQRVQSSPELRASSGSTGGHHANVPSGDSEQGHGGASAYVQQAHGQDRASHDEQDHSRHCPGEGVAGGQGECGHSDFEQVQGQGQGEGRRNAL